MTTEQRLAGAIVAALGTLHIPIDAQLVQLVRPARPEHGDWSTNVALVVAKAAGRAIFNVVLLPWVLLICSVALATPLVWRHRFGQELGVPFAGIFVFALVFCNSFFPGWAINELRDRFRFLAAQAWTRS